MITATKLKHIMGLTTGQVNTLMRRSGYKDEIKSAEFLGLSNSGEFCFKIEFFDHHTGLDETGKVWITQSADGSLVADF